MFCQNLMNSDMVNAVMRVLAILLWGIGCTISVITDNATIEEAILMTISFICGIYAGSIITSEKTK